MAKTGRPSSYTKEIGTAICERLALGQALTTICADDAMPPYGTVLRWRTEREDFREMYARAREDQADTLVDEILEAVRADTDRDEFGRVDGGAVQAKRLMVDALKWRASHLKPKVYGDKVQQEHSGPDGGPIIVSTGVPTK